MLFYFHKRLKKSLRFGSNCSSGRNFLGRVCIRGKYRGNKRLFLNIDRFRRICKYGIIISIFYESRFSYIIGCVLYTNGLLSYIALTKEKLILDAKIYSGSPLNEDEFLVEDGWASPLLYYKLFTQVCNIEFKPNKGFAICRSGGVSALLIAKTQKYATLKLRSGWQINVALINSAVKGINSDKYKKMHIVGSAGNARALGFRSKVRGVAKNPCDHPHGGGNGKKHKPVNPVSPWGKLAKGTPTKLKKKDFFLRRKYKVITN